MSSVTFSTAVGGDGSTVTDDTNPTTGLDGGGHRVRFVPSLAQTVAVAAHTVNKASEALASQVIAQEQASIAAGQVAIASAHATSAAGSVTVANTSATLAASSAAQSAAARDAAIAAAAVAALPTENLSAISGSIHSGTVVKAIIYDTSKDSDGGQWRKRCTDKSWYTEEIQTGKWLGQWVNESEARARNAGLTGNNLATNGTMDSTSGYLLIGTGGTMTAVNGELVIAATGGNVPAARQTVTGLTVGTSYKISVGVRRAASSTSVRLTVGGVSPAADSVVRAAAGSPGETLSVVFIATATSHNVEMGFTSASATGTAYFDNLQIFQVLTQPVGDYYQNTTDNKFYRLNASGVTEVFRGNTRGFPTVAGIVAEAARVVIYDMATPGCPMWRAFAPTARADALDWWRTGRVVKTCAALNAKVLFAVDLGSANDPASGLQVLDFARDLLSRYGNTASSGTAGPVSDAGVAAVPRAAGLTTLASTNVNDVAVTVLPNAPVDAVTGLAVPTVAVATVGGVSIIRQDGTVTSDTSVLGSASCRVVGFTSRGLLIRNWDTTSARWGVAKVQYPTSASDYNLYGVNTSPFVAPHLPWLSSNTGPCATSSALGSSSGVIRFTSDTADRTRLMLSQVSSTFTTGWLVGDNRLATLSDAVAGSVGPAPELMTNGTFDVDTTGWEGRNGGVLSAVGGKLRVTNTGGYGSAQHLQGFPTAVGARYRVTLVRTAGTGSGLWGVGTSNLEGSNVNIAVNLNQDFHEFTAVSATTYINLGVGGNIVGAYFDYDNISVKEVVSDRSAKSNSLTINGTLTKTEVAAAAQLMGYSGWSAANYLSQPYSSNLDFGTGEWTVGGWMAAYGAANANLVSAPEALDNAAWTSPAGTQGYQGSGVATVVTANYGAAPNGTVTADRIQFSLVGGADAASAVNRSGISLASALPIGRYTSSVYLKALDATNIPALFSAPVSAPLFTFGLIQGGDLEATVVEPLADGWYRVSRSVTATTAGGAIRLQLLSAPGSTANTADLLCWGVKVNQGITPGTYTPGQTSVYNTTASILDRSAPTGATISCGIDGYGRLVATAFDGTTTRTAITTATYNTNQWTKVRADYRSGRLSINVDGQEVAVTNGAPLLTLNNSEATLTIGNSRTLDAPFPGSLALWRMGATVPSADQAQTIYRTEQALLQPGAKCLIDGTSTSVTAMAYDADTDELHVGTSWGRSTFRDLLRVSSAAPSTGGAATLAAGGGMLLSGNVGATVYVPAQNLRDELKRKEDARKALGKEPVFFDFDAISFTATTTSASNVLTSVAGAVGTPYIGMAITGTGIPAGTTIIGINGTTYYLSANATASGSAVSMLQNSFVLQQGYSTKAVYSAELLKREGATKAYTRTFDGYRETVVFAVAPGSGVWVSIMAVRSN